MNPATPGLHHPLFKPFLVVFHVIAFCTYGGLMAFFIALGCGMGGSCSETDVVGWLLGTVLACGVIFSFPLYVLFLQERKDPRLGLLIFPHIGLAFWAASETGNEILTRHYAMELPPELTSVALLALSTIGIFLYAQIASAALFPTVHARKIAGFLIPLLILIAFAVPRIHTYADAEDPDQWKTFAARACGYTIEHPETLRGGGWSSTAESCGHWYFEKPSQGYNQLSLDIFPNPYNSVRVWAERGWPETPWTSLLYYFHQGQWGEKKAHSIFFDKENPETWKTYFAERLKPILAGAADIRVANYDALLLPTVVRTDGVRVFMVFIDTGRDSILLARCAYEDADMLAICNDMIESVTFVE